MFSARKKLLALLVLILLSGAGFAQKPASGGAKWERYAASKGKISILMPQLPTAIERSFVCSEFEAITYSAYRGGAVYQLEIDFKGSGFTSGCSKVARYSEDSFQGRVTELRAVKDKVAESPLVHQGYTGWKVSTRSETRWIFDDSKKKRWIELVITHHKGVNVDEDRYLESLDLTGAMKGINIGSGAKSSVGDVLDYEPEVIEDSLKAKQDATYENVRILAKPRPSYTDSARQNNVAGDVKLKVTFRANGSIGDISVVSGLQGGLTEQAIIAAKKVVFLPARKNGKLVTAALTIQYSFSIY